MKSFLIFIPDPCENCLSALRLRHKKARDVAKPLKQKLTFKNKLKLIKLIDFLIVKRRQ